jgi:uncharacterized protein YyaL (SSP411 family)
MTSTTNTPVNSPAHTNRLINEASPYLLQHAHNPVDWYPWGEEALEKARKEDKLLLISIGYSACHWCHVMEHETFENEQTATVMNKYFVCIKVDREERPDIDQIYMDAVQLINQRGGWPLNMFALPDGRPLHGGTYFPNQEWNQLLFSIENFYRTKKAEAEDFAAQLTRGIKEYDLVKPAEDKERFNVADLKNMFESWLPSFDKVEGGPNRAPKFPLPDTFQFLLKYYFTAKDERALQHVNLSLEKMAYGGIYDQLGGGFARYSVDGMWLVPHFEKMLYDNAQLVSLYADAYRLTGRELYREVTAQTLEFIERELMHESGGFYSALDADSEGVEGKFYCWSKKELQDILGESEPLFSAYYHVTEPANWEHDFNILHRKKSEEEFAAEHGLKPEEFRAFLGHCSRQLMEVRSKRIRPGLDDKIITCWNAMMMKGYVDAYKALGDKKYLATALKSAAFIKEKLYINNRLHRIHKNGKTSIGGFAEDYAFTIAGFISLYQETFDEHHLQFAAKLMEESLADFYDEEGGFFYFTSERDTPLVTRKYDITDDVIPSSNSSFAHSLYLLGEYFDRPDHIQKSEKMLANLKEKVLKHTPWYSHWAQLCFYQAAPFYQVVISGKEAIPKLRELDKFYLPNIMTAGSTVEKPELPLLHDRWNNHKTLVYVCRDKSCLLPSENIAEVVKMLEVKND